MTAATVAELGVPVNVVAKGYTWMNLMIWLVGYRIGKKVPVIVESSGNFDKYVENIAQKAALVLEEHIR